MPVTGASSLATPKSVKGDGAGESPTAISAPPTPTIAPAARPTRVICHRDMPSARRIGSSVEDSTVRRTSACPTTSKPAMTTDPQQACDHDQPPEQARDDRAEVRGPTRDDGLRRHVEEEGVRLDLRQGV